MAKTFKGFTNQQTHQLLKEMGFTGPAQKDEMDAFLASSPSAASKLGRYNEIAKQRVEGGPMSGMGMQEGGSTTPEGYKTVSRITPDVPTDTTTGTVEDEGDFVFDRAGDAYAGDRGVPDFSRSSADDGVTPPEGSQVIVEGTPTPETTQPSVDLDTAQQSYSDAMGQLTEAQKTLNEAEMPEGNSDLDAETNRLKFPTFDTLKEELGEDFGSGVTAVDGTNFLVGNDFKNIIADRDNIPTGDGFEVTGSAYNWTVTFNNGKTIKVNKNNASAAETVGRAAQTAFRNIRGSNIVSDTDAYNQLLENVADADTLVTQTQADVSTKQKQFETTDIPSTSEALGKAITSPSSVLSQPTVYGLKVENNQLIDEGTGQVATAASLLVKQAQAADAVEDPAVKATLAYLDGLTEEEKAAKYPMPEPPSLTLFQRLLGGTISDAEKTEYDKAVAGVHARIEQDAIAGRAETYDAKTSIDDVRTEVEKVTAAVGVLSEDAKMTAANMTPSDLAQLQGEFKDPAKLDSYNVILTEDDIVRINEERTRMQAGMANALAIGNTAAYEDIKAAYEQAGAAVQKAYETGTVVGDLEEDERQYPAAAKFDSYTKSEEVIAEAPDEIEAAEFETETPKATAEVDYDLPPTEVAKVEESAIQDAAKFDEYATAPEKKSEYVPDVTAEETTVGEDEIADINDILNNEEVIVTAKTLEALNEASTAKAATATFSQQLEAKSITGTVSGNATVQGQMEKLMASFNDGTPAWAAGALRKANAAMTARGLGGSSMAMAAIAQATIESALPIAQQDAATFAAMDMENVRNEQAVALANAAAAQNFELANLSNEQAVRIQNSMNNANLQLQNLSNEQEAVLAMAGFKASLQGQELSISANVALSNAARYAAVNDINLTNRQQTTLLKSTQNLEVEMANLSNSQQTALSNLQVQASMMGQELTNEQQMAVLESTQAFETNMQDATNKQQAFIQDAVAKAAMEGRVLDNKQQTALFNISNQVAERGIELNNEQQTRIFNMSNKMTIDVENLSSRQQTALANAQIEATMKGQELSNKQQSNVIKAERIAEVANMNFTAEQSRALQNAQLTQTVDLANLSNAQAKLLADCAALSDVDMANLSNNQQAAAQQAQAFLEMDMANLDNEQQVVMFEAQSLVQSIFSDQAAENAQLQFNAESINQVNQFYDSMTTQVQQFNTAQANAMEQFNAGEENSMTKFQAELDNQRDMFNASNELVIAQANTVWRQSVATANTAALNEANMAEVMAANNLTMTGLNELWQQERDLMSMAWETADNAMNRDAQIAIANINKSGDAGDSNTWGDMLSSTAGTILVKGISNILGFS
jgi:hypothetical protein